MEGLVAQCPGRSEAEDLVASDDASLGEALTLASAKTALSRDWEVHAEFLNRPYCPAKFSWTPRNMPSGIWS